MGTSSIDAKRLEIPTLGRWYLGCKLLYSETAHLHRDTDLVNAQLRRHGSQFYV